MPDLGHRRSRRLTMAGLIGLLIAGLLLPMTAGLAAAAEPGSAGRGDIVGTFEAAPTFGTTAVAPGTVGVKSSLGYQYGDGSTAIVGEILNLRTLRTINVLVTVTYLDADDDPIGTESAYVYLERTSRGGVAPFVIFNPDGPAGTVTYLVDASAGSSTSTVVGGALDIVEGPTVTDPDFRYYEGTITNPNAFVVTDMTVMVTVYDDAGDVIEVFAQDDLQDLDPGETIDYSIGVDLDLDATTARATILADGERSGQAGVYITAWANYFDDLPLTTFRPDIIWLAQERITTGCAPGRFCPTANVTRAQMALFLDRALDLPATSTDYFEDDDGVTGEASINRLAASGITGGCAPDRFCPTSGVKRDQMASFLARAMGIASGSAPDVFTDDEGNTHESNINRIAQAGITGGCATNKYCPSASVTRGQMAAFLRRAFQE
jgi:hypothetical protein